MAPDPAPDPAPEPPVVSAVGRRRHLWIYGFGMVRTGWRYAVHRVPLFRRGRRAGEQPTPPDLDRQVVGDPTTVQRARDGVGPLYHRRYSIGFTDTDLGPHQLMQRIRSDINAAVPTDMAAFVDEGDRPDPARLGEEYVVVLPGPWNGPVRVVEADDRSFTLMTLRGHMEAGQITFRTGTHPEHGWVTFEIESWARSATRTFHLMYDVLPIGREMQLHMWASFCEAVAALAGGVVMTSVEVETHTSGWPAVVPGRQGAPADAAVPAEVG
jgi:hypothetical protein